LARQRRGERKGQNGERKAPVSRRRICSDVHRASEIFNGEPRRRDKRICQVSQHGNRSHLRRCRQKRPSFGWPRCAYCRRVSGAHRQREGMNGAVCAILARSVNGAVCAILARSGSIARFNCQAPRHSGSILAYCRKWALGGGYSASKQRRFCAVRLMRRRPSDHELVPDFPHIIEGLGQTTRPGIEPSLLKKRTGLRDVAARIPRNDCLRAETNRAIVAVAGRTGSVSSGGDWPGRRNHPNGRYFLATCGKIRFGGGAA
jgi:hypothetical protein